MIFIFDGVTLQTSHNMWTLKFKAQLTNAFFATINQMFGGSSQLPTMLSELCSTPHAKHLKMLSTVRRQVKMEAFGKAEVIHMRDICK